MSKLRFVAYTEPGIGNLTPIIEVPVLPGASGTKEHSAWSDLNFAVPSDWPHFSKLLSDTTGSIIRVFAPDGVTIIDECFVDRMPVSTDIPGVRSIMGPQVQGAVEFCGIYPYNWPTHLESWLNWVWGGQQLLSNTDADAGTVDEAQTITVTVESPKHTHLVSSINATQTTFDVDNASVFGPAPSYCIIDSERMKITGIAVNTLTVTRGDAGTTAASHSAGINNIHKVPGGTFTVTFDGQTTTALDFNPDGSIDTDAADLQAALEALTNITDVTVTAEDTTKATPSPDHSGVLSSDEVFNKRVYAVEFHDPSGGINQVTVGDSIVNASTAVETASPGGLAAPDPWTVALDPNGEKIGTYVDPEIRTSDPAGGEIADAIAIFARSRYAGGQQKVSVSPGGIAQASTNVWPNVAGVYVLVIRDANTNLQIARSADTSCAAGIETTISLTDVVIPENTEEVVFRVSVVSSDPATHDSFFIVGPSMKEGFAPATPGEIVRVLVQAAQARGTFLWVDISSFSDTVDSAGNAWPTEHSFTAWADSNLGHVLSDFRSMGDSANAGYRWQLVPKSTPTGTPPNELTHDLEMYVPGAGGTNYTTGPGAPTLTTGTIVKGDMVQRRPTFTTLLAHGGEGLYLEKIDATLEANFTRRERIADVEHLTSGASLQEFVDAAFGDEQDNLRALAAQVGGDASKLPLVDYKPMDTIWWQFPGIQDRIAKPISQISWIHGSQIALFDVQGSRILSEDAGISTAVEWMLKQFTPRSRRGRGATRVVGGDVAVPVGAFIHLAREASQAIPAGGDVILWDQLEVAGVGEFSEPAYPAVSVEIPKNNYYNIVVAFDWATYVNGGTVSIIRERDGADKALTPPNHDPNLWSSDRGWRFSETAHAHYLKKGDTIRVEVDHGDAATQTLTKALLSVYAVDRLGGEPTLRYAPLVLSHGPLAYWRLDELSGVNAADSAGHPLGPFTGTYAGSPSLNQSGLMTDGSGNPSVVFDGVNDEVDIGDIATLEFTGSAPFSVEAWINLSISAPLISHVYVHKQDYSAPTGPNFGWVLGSRLDGAGNVDFVFERWNGTIAGGQDQDAVTALKFSKGVTYHIVGTYDGVDAKIYVNSVLEDTDSTVVSLPTTTASLEIGHRTDSGEFAKAVIDEVAIYDRALSQAEISEHYEVGRGAV